MQHSIRKTSYTKPDKIVHKSDTIYFPTSCSPKCFGANLTSVTEVLLSTKDVLFTFKIIIQIVHNKYTWVLSKSDKITNDWGVVNT